MKLQLNEDEVFVLHLTAAELVAIQAGLRETIECLDDDFATRTGMERSEMQAVLRELVEQRKSLHL